MLIIDSYRNQFLLDKVKKKMIKINSFLNEIHWNRRMTLFSIENILRNNGFNVNVIHDNTANTFFSHRNGATLEFNRNN